MATRMKIFSSTSLTTLATNFNSFVQTNEDNGFEVDVQSQEIVWDGANYVVSVIYSLNEI